MLNQIGLVARYLLIASLVLLPAAHAHATFCAPPSPTPNDTPPLPDEPPCCGGDSVCENCNASPVFAKSGVYTTFAADLALPTNGLPLAVARSYESSHVVDGPVGYGWRSNFGTRLYYATYLFTAPATFSKEAVIVMPDGDTYRYSESANGSFAPPNGRRDTLVRSADGKFTLTLQRTNARYIFDTDGALLSMADEFGNTVRFTHDAGRRIVRADDESGTGRYLIVTWNPSGRIGSVQDHAGRVVSYSYGTNGTLTAVTNPAGQSTIYTYEQRRFAPQLSRVRDHWGRVLVEVDWDSADRVARYTEGGAEYRMSYLPADQSNPARTVKTHSKGSQTVYYDSNGLVTSRGGAAMSYTPEGDMASFGTGIQYTYTTLGRIASMHTGGDVAFHYTYDANYPYKVARVEPRLRANAGLYHGHWLGWRYTYYLPSETTSGALPGALKKIERLAFQYGTTTVLTDGDPISLYAEFSYDGKGRVTRSWDRTSLETKYVYDDAARTVYTYRPSNGAGVGERASIQTFDALGRQVSMTDPLGNVTTYEYDVLGRTTKVTLPKPNPTSPLVFETTIRYDNVGSNPDLQYTHVTDFNGRVTKQGFDAFGRVVESVDAAGHTTTHAYTDGLLSSITDPNGNVTTYSYDSGRRLAGITWPDGKSERYQYNSDSTLRSRTDRKGTTTTYAYDAYGRMSSQTTGSQSRSYTYEGQKLITVSDTYSGASDFLQYTYDPKTFLPLSEKQGLGTGVARGVIDYTWATTADLLSTYKVTDPDAPPSDAQTVSYAYSPDGSVSRINWSRGLGVYQFTYDAHGRQTRVTLANGQTRNFTYDNQGRLTRVSNLLNSTTNLATFDYEYDRENTTGAYTVLGQRTKMTAIVPSLSSLPKTTQYFYDVHNQLIRSSTTSGATTAERTWTYDAIGNRLTQTVGGSVTSYSYVKNAANTNTARLSAAGADPVGHDANGNMTTLGTITYAWDVLDRLKTRTQWAPYNFSYDALDRRVRVDQQSTKFVYHRNQLVDMSYRKSGNAYHRTNYLFGPNVDEPLARVDSTAVTYYAVDGLGSVILLSDAHGTVKNKYEYGAWGEVQTRSEQLVQPFAYTAREFTLIDAGTFENDYYYRARYLVPNIGRFIAEDPLRFAQGVNFYVYARNDGVNNTDPLGRQYIPVCTGTPWTYTGRSYVHGVSMTLWKLYKETEIGVPMPYYGGTPPPAPGWGQPLGGADTLSTGFCLCIYERRGLVERITTRWIYERYLDCHPCSANRREEMEVQSAPEYIYGPPAIFAVPGEQRQIGIAPCGVCPRERYQ